MHAWSFLLNEAVHRKVSGVTEDCGRLIRDMDMALDPCENRLHKLSTVYLNIKIGHRM